MVTKARQKKLRSLITEAVRHLSKDVLEHDFTEELTVEGLLGITLDNQDVLLVNINETFYRENDEEDEAPHQMQRRTLRSAPVLQSTPNASPRISQPPRATPQLQQRASAMKRKLETTSPSQPAKRQTPTALPTRATRSTPAQRETEPEPETKEMTVEMSIAQESGYDEQAMIQQEPEIEHISATDATATTQEITTLDDLVQSAQGPDAAPQVYLPINIAKSTSLKLTEFEGQVHQEVHTEYADNVYVPISIERTTEVKVEMDPLGDVIPGISGETSDTDNLEQELELHVASDKDSNTEHLEKRANPRGGKPSWVCTICEKVYHNKPKAQIHVQRHFTPQCVCYWCGQQFLMAVELRQHAQVVHNEVVHVCEECNKAFKLKKTYKHHMQDHEGNYAKICPICQKGCKTNHYYKLHMMSHEAKEGKTDRHICPTCGKQFGLKMSMRNHLRHTPCGKAVYESHSELREKFDCPICGASIYGLNKLNQHLELKHKTTVVYKCQYCGTDFNKKVVLASHENWCRKQQAMKEYAEAETSGETSQVGVAVGVDVMVDPEEEEDTIGDDE